MLKKSFLLILSLLLLSSCVGRNDSDRESGKAESLIQKKYYSFDDFINKIDAADYLKSETPSLMTLQKGGDKLAFQYADLLLSNNIVFDPKWEAIQIDDILWNEDPYDHDSWVLYFQSMNFIPYLVIAYDNSGDEKYIQKAEEYILHWIEKNPINEPIVSHLSWNDHGTANRVKNIVHFLSKYKNSDSFNQESFNTILYSLYIHGLFLSNDSNYIPSNHGIMQDQALFELALIFDFFPDADSWFDTALRRSYESLDRDITSEGVHREHSPQYHIFVQNLFMQTEKFLTEMNVTEVKFSETIEKMNLYTKYTKTPSGHYPQISDTHRIENKRLSNYPELEEIVFKETGVAFLRDVEKTSQEDIYLMFVAAYNSSIHKHKDDLSFILSIGETDFFVDGGYLNYNKGIERSYFVSPLAHNTLMLNNEAWFFDEGNIFNPTIESYGLNDDLSYIVASHTMYDDAKITRTLIYLKPDLIIIHDNVDTDDDQYESMQQILNIGKDVDVVSVSESEYKLQSLINDTYLTLKQINPIGTQVTKYSGSTEPFMGWQSHALDQKHPITSLIFDKDLNKSEDFFTMISINNDSDIKDITFDKSTSKYSISTNDGVEYITLPDSN